MSVLSSLFGKSPFRPLQSHMEKVAECVEKVGALFDAYFQNDFDRIKELSDQISDLEHAADLTKNEIRNNLPKGLFLAINRGDLLDILAQQDNIADKAEDIGIMMTLKNLEPLKGMEEDLKLFIQKNIQAANRAHQIIREMDELLEASFSGKEADRVRLMIDEVAFLEHEVDVIQYQLNKKLYNMDDQLSYSSFILWNNVIQAIAALSNLSEKLANRVRMLLDIH